MDSTEYRAFHASNPPAKAVAANPNSRNWCATRTLVASPDQLQ